MASDVPKIVAFSGSSRSGSYNQTLVQIAASGARESGAEVTIVNLGDFELPIFNEELEKQSPPADAKKLRDVFESHHAFLISSPEYNSSISPLLKNAIDWASRPVEGKLPLFAYRDKVAGLMAASPGGLGGLRGLVHVRAILGNIGVTVLPNQVAIPRASEAFDDAGNLKDEKQQQMVKEIGSSVSEMVRKLIR